MYHVYHNQYKLSNCVWLLLLQMNNVWLTSDYKAFVTAEWNTRLLMLASHFDMLWEESEHQMKCPLQPGIDDNCAVNLYMRNNKPSWVMLPCDQQVSSYWICRKQPRVHKAIQKLGYPLFWCRGLCLLIWNACYEYKLLQTNSNSSVVCSIDNAYLFHFNKNFANHGIDVHFCGLHRQGVI